MANFEASFEINPPSLEADFDISTPSIEADFDLNQTTIDAVFEINTTGAQKVSDLTDVKLLNLQDGQVLAYDASVNKWVNTTNVSSAAWGAITGVLSNQTDLQSALNAKQDTLVSGTNIRTINSSSILGSGDITVTASTYIYEQGTASDTWTIQHNLNKFPSVSVVDTAGNVLTCAVNYISRDICKVTMNGASKGKAYLN